MGIYRTTGKTITPTVARNVVRRMHDLHITADQLHEQAKLAHSTIARITNGQGDDISHPSAARLCDLLQTTWFALSNDAPGTIVYPDTNTSYPLTAAGYNSFALTIPAPSAPSAVRSCGSLPIANYQSSIPVHPLPVPYDSGLTSCRCAPVLHRILYGLRTWPWRVLLDIFLNKITFAYLHQQPPRRPFTRAQLRDAYRAEFITQEAPHV